MSTSAYVDIDVDDDVEGSYQPYRSLSKAAVLSLIFAAISLFALASPLLVIVPAVGVALGIRALANIRRYPDELSGRAVAWLGLVCSGLLLLGSATLHAVVHATEVPEDCIRISFADLQPSKEAPDSPVPPRAKDLDGQRVFIKGYLYPDGQQFDIKRFVMIPDMGTCCFGGQPELTDMIEVTLRDPLRVEFQRRKRKFAGVLHVDDQLKPVSGLGGVYYRLDADYVR